MLNAYFEDYNQEENTNFEGKSKKSTGKLKVSILKEKLVDSVDKNYQNDLVKASKVKQIINPSLPLPPQKTTSENTCTLHKFWRALKSLGPHKADESKKYLEDKKNAIILMSKTKCIVVY